MAKGKQTCKILKEIRKQIAEDNDINLVVSECTYQGDCKGTCPKCEAEVRYLERELEKRQRLGKAAVFAGMSLSTMLAAAACDSTSKMPASDSSFSKGRLRGEVAVEEPEKQEPDSVVITNDLMGVVAYFHTVYEFDAEQYQNLMKEKFLPSKMKDLSVVGGKIDYGRVARGEVCDTFEKLVDAAIEFQAPYYERGDEMFLEELVSQLNVDPRQYKGDMEVAFLVDEMGQLFDFKVQKGIDKVLDDEVVYAMMPMEFRPAYYKLKNEPDRQRFECRCVLTIHFPIISEPVMLEGEPPVPIEDTNVIIIKDPKN